MNPLRLVTTFTLLALTACDARSGGGTFGGFVDDAATDDAGGMILDAGASDDAAASDAPVAAKDVVTPPSDIVTAADIPTVTPRCGDGTCDEGESCESCRADCAFMCPPPPDVPTVRCGDGTCSEGESCESCRADCAFMCPPPPDVPTARCGDGTCSEGETCSSCASDCGACSTGALTDPCPSTSSQGPSRDCGWRLGTPLSCSPGRATMVGCSGSSGTGSLCQPAYGSCTGDPVMRVCPGTTPCTAAMALTPLSGSFDDQCGTCPSAYVTCPSSGMINVLTGDYNSNQPTQRGTCTAAAR
ncbi:MAG: hypothetical protein R3A48_00815 [Polyangiales bacterium]